MLRFGLATRTWFDSEFAAPTPVQERGWRQIAAGDHALLIAPTGSGKTLAAFLWCIDRLAHAGPRTPGVRILYVSPLKALVYDVERNLRRPIAGIERVATEQQIDLALPRVAVRTGDTSARDRRHHISHPAEILVTTPESLYLMLGSRVRETLRTVDTVIIDEVHALAPTKRGAHLAVSLERLASITGSDPQRIGLSATARPYAEVARFLGGDRDVRIVDAGALPHVDLRVVVPVQDMTRPQQKKHPPDAVENPGQRGLWPTIHARLVALVRSHAATIVFVNSRGLCERLTQQLNETAGEELVRSHHGSLSHGERRHIEEELKAGRIPCIVATSSLELGIDMGAIDLVVLVESPGSVARGLQRVGRAGHHVGEVSKGRVFPTHRGDLLEAAVVAARMGEGEIEMLRVPANPLDVLAQQIVAMVATEPRTVDEIAQLVRRSATYHSLPDSALFGVLDMLAGRYPSHEFADLRPRLVWDRDTHALTPRRGARMLSLVSGGTIPDRGTYAVHLGEGGPRVGELDEEMVHEIIAGQTFTLGATTWRVEQITRDRVFVSAAPGESGRLPFWHGQGPGRPIELGRAMGSFVRELGAMTLDSARATLSERCRLDDLAVANLLTYLAEQREATGTLPTDRSVTIERFRDEVGDWRVCILSPFGTRVHAPWALAIQAALHAAGGHDAQALWTDDGIAMRWGDADRPPDTALMLPDPDQVEEFILAGLASSALFASQFRENAARALLMPRHRPGQRTPLWLQRLKSQRLLAIAQAFPAFPIIVETYRSCLQDVFDVPALVDLLRAIRRRDVHVEAVDTAAASPFSRSLMFAYVADNLYDGDAPAAERRARALSIDRHLLRELLGQEDLRSLLDAQTMEDVEAELQRLPLSRRARNEDHVHDLLRWLGDLSDEELRLRTVDDADPANLIASLASQHRAVRVTIADEPRWVAVEDAGLYRDALDTPLPGHVPAALAGPIDGAIGELLHRYARTHGPFATRAVSTRYGIPVGQAEALLGTLEARGLLLRDAMRPGTTGQQWCEPDVLRRIKRRTLAMLRDEVAPVPCSLLARFLPAWYGLGGARRGLDRARAAIEQLEGLPLAYSDLERAVLPARVADFSPAMLDELGGTGWLVWVGHGSLGKSDGRVALYRRDRVAALLDPPDVPDDLSPLALRVLSHLQQAGAAFFVALQSGTAAASDELMAALWELVWAGLITNDTFQPLRALKRPTAGRRRGKARARGTAVAASGRWSLVSTLLEAAPSPTERAHTRAVTLLERHGIVTREVANLESMPGGFSAVYPVLRAMEDAGTVRRGYFLDGLGGAQFADLGAVDKLRALRATSDAHAPLVLSAIDPANPFGWAIPWPAPSGEPREGSGPRRVAGAVVVLVDGAPVIYLDAGGKRMHTFPAAANRDRFARAAACLESVAARQPKRWLRIETIDDEKARASIYAEQLTAAGLYPDHRGLVIEPRRRHEAPG